MSPQEAIYKVYKGSRNWMTPEVIWIRSIGPYAVELSKGTFNGQHIYGVSVVTLEGQRTNLSQGGFHNKELALEYIAKLGDQ